MQASAPGHSAHAASKGGIAYPSQATIAKDIGYGTSSKHGTRSKHDTHQVRRAIAGLVQVGAIEIVYRTKQAARDAGISIKGDPVLDKNGAPVQENLNTMRVLFGWDGMCKQAISPQDKAVLDEHMKGAHDATGKPPGKPRTAKKLQTIQPDVAPGVQPDVAPGVQPDVAPGVQPDVAPKHLTVVLEHRLDNWNTEKGSLKASLSLSPGEPAPPAEKEKSAEPATNHPLSCLEFLKAFKSYNPKWVWTRASIARFKQNWESNPNFRSLASKIIASLQSNTELPKFCPNLDPNYLFYTRDSHDLMIWEKLLTGVAYFSSTKQPTPEPDWNLLYAQQEARFAAEDRYSERRSTMLKFLTDAEWEERRSSPDIDAWDKARLDALTTTEQQDPGAGKPAPGPVEVEPPGTTEQDPPIPATPQPPEQKNKH